GTETAAMSTTSTKEAPRKKTKKSEGKRKAEVQQGGEKKDLNALASQIREGHEAWIASVKTGIEHALRAGELRIAGGGALRRRPASPRATVRPRQKVPIGSVLVRDDSLPSVVPSIDGEMERTLPSPKRKLQPPPLWELPNWMLNASDGDLAI